MDVIVPVFKAFRIFCRLDPTAGFALSVNRCLLCPSETSDRSVQ